MTIPPLNRQITIALVLLILTCTGCSTTEVEVPTTRFPVPLVEKYPVIMGLTLPEALTTFSHEEDLGDGGEFRINIGDAQEVMFVNLLAGMFERTHMIEDPTHPDIGVDAVLVPLIAELQFSTPSQTRTDYFEVWLRYQFQLYSRDGTLLGEWPLTAYGKANTQNYLLSTTEPALQEAALSACRDAMAFFTVQFRTVPVVQKWLYAELLRDKPAGGGLQGADDSLQRADADRPGASADQQTASGNDEGGDAATADSGDDDEGDET